MRQWVFPRTWAPNEYLSPAFQGPAIREWKRQLHYQHHLKLHCTKRGGLPVPSISGHGYPPPPFRPHYYKCWKRSSSVSMLMVFLILNTSFQPDRWTDLTHPLEPAQETCWDGVTRKGKDRFHIFCCSNDFPALCWEQVSTFQLAPGLRNTHSLFHPADQHPLLSQAHVIITYYYNTSVMTACRTSGSPCTLSARQTHCENSKNLQELTNSHSFYKTLHIVLCYLWCLLLSKATIMQTLGHLLNFSVTNYTITINGLISKSSFLLREGRLLGLHAVSLEQLPGEAGERQLGAPTVTLQLQKQFWQRYQVLPA